MAKCQRCGKWGLFLKLDEQKLCPECHKLYLEQRHRTEMQAKRAAVNRDSVEYIRSLGISDMPHGIDDIKQDLPYVLQRKATEYKRNGRLDLAIECLYKANELMPYSDFLYMSSDYNRLISYLKQARRFDEAEKLEKELGLGAEKVNEEITAAADVSILARAQQLGTDLVEMSTTPFPCEICGKYMGRVFSLSGKDKRFPKLPVDFHESCGCMLYPFVYGVSDAMYTGGMDVIKFSNRPFVDGRTPEQKRRYEEKVREEAAMAKDRADYDWLWKNLPEICPKSFSGYRRMKNSSSKNYQKLCEQAAANGRQL